ncbi:MAG TPA: hypothetical protein VF261_02380 [Candidatus Saccharimonadales bacterium]
MSGQKVMATKPSGNSGSKTAAPSSPKVFDVARPGKSSPSTSAKPIIVTNRPIMHDPMVVPPNSTPDSGDASAAGSDTPAPAAEHPVAVAAPSSTRVKIAPLHTAEELSKAEAAEENEGQDTSTDADTKGAAKASADNQSPQPEAARDTSKSNATEEAQKGSEPTADDASQGTAAGSAENDKKAETPAAEGSATTADSPSGEQDAGDTAAKDATDPKADDEAVRAAAAHAAEIDKLAESHKYYLPINQVEKRRNKRSAALGLVLIILLCLAWLDIALDAGIFRLGGIHPITHFFSR